MECKRPKNIHALESFESSRELCLGETESMSEMKSAIHVRVRKRHEKLGFSCLHMRLVELHLRPLPLHLKLILSQMISSSK